jgi:hypothetical protein
MTFKELSARQHKSPLSLLSSDISEEMADAAGLLGWLGNHSPMMIAWFVIMTVNLLLILLII